MTLLLAHITGGNGLLDGLLHPLTGADHLAAMLLVGALAYLMRDRMAWWVLPATFVGSMVPGGVAGIAGLPTPDWVEVIVAAGVVVLALALLRSEWLTVPAAMTAVGLVAAAHGLAHGAEIPATASPAAFVAGFVIATAAIHLAGAGVGRLTTAHRLVRTATGATAAGLGIALLVR